MRSTTRASCGRPSTNRNGVNVARSAGLLVATRSRKAFVHPTITKLFQTQPAWYLTRKRVAVREMRAADHDHLMIEPREEIGTTPRAFEQRLAIQQRTELFRTLVPRDLRRQGSQPRPFAPRQNQRPRRRDPF